MSTDCQPAEAVTALVTHHNRPHLIGDALASLLAQTRRPDHIVVMDDASEAVPLGSIPADDLISVYRSETNVGPYRLLDWGVRNVKSSWYMVQDSDDTSEPTRLERQLIAAIAERADMVGSLVSNWRAIDSKEWIMQFAADANEAHLKGAWPPCALCSSIFRRELWDRIGGFATGLRFSADAEFASRACYAGRVINLTSVELRRRVFPDSLTQRPDTGMKSPARLALRQQLLAQSRSRMADRIAGRPVDLTPFSTASEIQLTRVR